MRTSGLAPLKTRLRELERAGRPTVRIRLPMTDGARLAALYRDGEVLARRGARRRLDLRVRLDRWQVEKLQREGVEVVAERGEERRAAG
jgi:hypothetical protein